MSGKRMIVGLVAVLLLGYTGVSSASFIVPTWTGPFTPAEKSVVERAISQWESKINSVNNLLIDFICDNTMSGNGSTSITEFYTTHQKQPKKATIKLNNGLLFWDTTLDTDDDIPSDKRDALSTTIHEIAHALGFTVTLNPTGGFASHVKDLPGDSPDLGKVWTDGTLTVDMDDAHMTHTVATGLMFWTGALGVRNVIEPFHVSMLMKSHTCYVPEPSTLAIWSLLTLCGIGLRRRKT